MSIGLFWGKFWGSEIVDLSERIHEINQQLEKVSLRQKGGKLYVRGRTDDTFPPRPGEWEVKRVEFALDCNATLPGLKVARLKVQEIDHQLLWGKFDWTPHLRGKNKPAQTVAEWVEKYEAAHWECTPRTPTKENSYHKNYRLFFKRLPQHETLTLNLLRSVILRESKPATRSRQFFCMAYGKLAEFVSQKGAIVLDELVLFQKELKDLRQGYSPEEILPEDLPTDEQIVEIWNSIKNPAWKWVYGMLATYGMRPHEIFRLDVQRYNHSTEVLRVFEETKTGTRLVYPCLPVWRERFELWNVQYPKIRVEGRNNNDLGEKISQEFRERKIPHNPYALRHAWCIRTALLEVPDTIAAKWAGHSVAVRTETYHQAISKAQHERVFDQMKQNEQNYLKVTRLSSGRGES
ncbi:hypothetical protein K9N68_05750 [Kovacikia minuta CCNUW1]|uniref:hypothetical protein n=1 Tax=Kovacikia minuta TaxID=2931930 RepID=UPI001CCA4CD3|nr:hypothetical protein [Kovacikia minuta]UBF27449.1 hypothetical protein K9N68_05750 [Kovacikia minuta CCNUW1]